MDEISFRYATEKDVKTIICFIKELAEYEKMSNQVIATEENLKKWIFDNKRAEVLFITKGDIIIGFSLFFYNFSTFLGKSGMYIEDLYIKEDYRHKGYGKLFIKQIAKIAVERECERLEWCCLDWNKPSIDFYLSLGAKQMNEWTTYRLTRKALEELVSVKD